jgi:hypothetical protein
MARRQTTGSACLAAALGRLTRTPANTTSTRFFRNSPILTGATPRCRAAIHDAMRFWLARGVDGFRVDALDMLLENPDLPDNPPNPNFDPSGPLDAAVFQVHNRSQPGVHQHIAALRSVCGEFGDRVLLGEVYTSPEELGSILRHSWAARTESAPESAALEPTLGRRGDCQLYHAILGHGLAARLAKLGLGQSRFPSSGQPSQRKTSFAWRRCSY